MHMQLSVEVMDRFDRDDCTVGMTPIIRTVTLVAAAGATTAGGVFLAFSTFLFRATGRVPDRDALTAMQTLDRAAPTPVFTAALVGTALVCLGLVSVAARHADEPYSPTLFIGSGLLLACIAMTIAYHVPRNDALALIDPASSDAARAWTRYARAWTVWNLMRAVSSLAAAAALTMSLVADRTRLTV